MRKQAKIFQALSDTNRIRILKMLEMRPLCVCEITDVLKLATSTVSKHLSILRDAGFIIDEKEGRWVNYYLSPDQIDDTVMVKTTGAAVVIDPADEGERIVDEAKNRSWRIGSIWLTHAHFDHLGGAAGVADALDPAPPVALHPEDYPLWRIQGGAAFFGMRIDPG